MDLAPEYSFSILETAPREHQITLTHNESSKTKTFKLCGGQTVESLSRHMNSLTTDQCKSFIK